MRQTPSRSRPSPRKTIAGATLIILANFGCSAMAIADQAIYHVNSFRVSCVGVAPMSCLQVRRDEAPAGEWQTFYSQIHGFDYRPGYLYRVLVMETQLPPDRVPADASSIRYDLVEILDKSVDKRFAVHDIWVVERIDGIGINDIDPESPVEQPYLEFNITLGEYLGNDGCSAFSGELLVINGDAMRLGPATKEDSNGSCGNGVLQTRLTDALERITHWRREQLWLTLLDDEGVEVLALRKVD